MLLHYLAKDGNTKIASLHSVMLYYWLDKELSLLTATDITADLVNDECGQQTVACNTPFLGFVWYIRSILVKMKGGSAVTK